MECKFKILFIVWLLIPPFSSSAMDMDEMMDGEQTSFHSFTLETDVGAGREGAVRTWDFQGWMGNDINKLFVRSEGENVDHHTEKAEIWGMYSRNITEFWDAQIGLREDLKPEPTSFFVIGGEGLAKYFFETEAHLFLSDEGDISARIEQKNDFLVMQKLILQPYIELNIYAQDVSDYEVGQGIANDEIGLQTRYEITRKFAPYIDVKYESKFGETAGIVEAGGEAKDDTIVSVGVRFRF